MTDDKIFNLNSFSDPSKKTLALPSNKVCTPYPCEPQRSFEFGGVTQRSLILQDTFVLQSDADNVFYPDITDVIRTADWSASTDYHGFMKVNILGYSEPVSSAILTLHFGFYANDTNPVSTFSIRNLSDLTDTDEWDEETVTWNNQPNRSGGAGSEDLVEVDLPFSELLVDPGFGGSESGTINESHSFNITSILNPYISAGLNTATFVFQRFTGRLDFDAIETVTGVKPTLAITK